MATFSPDAKYIFCGTSEQKINCWSAVSLKKINFLCSMFENHVPYITKIKESGRLIHSFQTDHPHTIEQVAFNPRSFMLASACHHLVCFTSRHNLNNKIPKCRNSGSHPWTSKDDDNTQQLPRIEFIFD